MIAGAYTLKDAAEYVYRDVRGGASPSSDLVRDRVNQAISLALNTQYAKGVYNTWVVKTHPSGVLLLPPEIESAEMIKSDERGYAIRGQWYSYLQQTARDVELNKLKPLELEDLGDGWVHDQNLCEPQFIMALVEQPHGTPNKEFEGLTIHIQGIDGQGDPVWGPEGQPGFSLPLLPGRPSYSDLSATHIPICVQTITAVSKPLTKWPVVLYGYKDIKNVKQLQEGESPTLTQITRILPWETGVSRRKYRYVGQGTIPESVEVFGRYRFRTLRWDNEILPIQDLAAIRRYIMQLENEREGKVDVAMYHKAQAREDLDNSLRKHAGNTLQGKIPIVNDGSSGYGDVFNL